jgi:NitT/TauT family transport system substrate-binding protein
MKKFLKIGLIVAVALFSGLFLATTHTHKAKAATLKTMKVGYMSAVNSVGLAAIANESNYYAKQGIRVKLVQFSDGPSIIAAMESGSIDVGEIGSGAHTLLAQGKAKVILMDGLSTSTEVISNTKKGIKSIKELKGKKVAVASGTSGEAILKLALKKAEMTESDLTTVSMETTAIPAAMISGKVDACATWAPGTTSIKEQLGSVAKTLASDKDFIKEQPSICSWVTTDAYYKKNKSTLVNFDKAMFAAMDYRKAGGKNAAKWISTQLATEEVAVKTQIKSTEKLYSKRQVKKLTISGALVKLYDLQQSNFIANGTLKDTGDLLTAKDYVLTDVLKEAEK